MFSRHIAYKLVFALTAVLLFFGSTSAVAWADPCPDPDSAEYKACRQWWLEQHKQRSSVTTYSVQSGDTLWSIATHFDLDVDTLRYSNPAVKRNPDVLAVGQQIRVLSFIGAIHQVKKGDTLTSIARRWNVTPETIAAYSANYIHNGLVQPGQELVIPGGYLDLNIPRPAASLSAKFAWPLRGWLTQRYSARHPAVDVATSYGATVYAAAGGVVVRTGWLFTGYGYSVIISHGNGFQTLYSHLKGPLVAVGQRVRRGQAIGAVGSTGRSTGPHVHFEVRKDGIRVDPLPYLPSLPPR